MSIQKVTDNNPGAGVSVEQLQSYQPVLVPQFSVKITSARIWSDQVIMDHFSELTYVHLMKSTSQEENLAGKPAFERWADTFIVKIKRYHADNGIFSKQSFRS